MTLDYGMPVLCGAGVIGLFVGLLTGIFGVGGGFLMTPALMIVLGVSGPVAVGTGLATTLANSTMGIIRRRGSDTVDVKLALYIAGSSIIGVLLGSSLLEYLDKADPIVILGKEQKAVEYVLFCFFLVLLAGIAIFLYSDYVRTGGKAPEKRIGFWAKIHVPPYLTFKSLEEPRMSLWPLLGGGLVIGLLTGLLGIGGGVVLLPVLVYFVGQRTAKAAGTSLLLVWISSLVAVATKGAQGDISLHLFGALLSGGIVGTWLGTKIGLKLAGPRVRLYFVFVVLAAVLMVGYKLFRITFLP